MGGSNRSPRQAVSIHAPREGCDHTDTTGDVANVMFQFTHPGRGATVLSSEVSQADKVSIHAPREGCDLLCFVCPSRTSVSIHAPREGCDTNSATSVRDFLLFQFTHPGRGATPTAKALTQIGRQFQFTHPGRGATCVEVDLSALDQVSIHAPREGCD